MARHRGRCRICQHPEREEIEREFLDWMSPREIAETWKIASYRAIYRHAHAVGLFQRRRENRLAALDRIIERVGEVKVTAAAVVAAIRLSAKLEREEKDEVQARRTEREFELSLEGLPRTDAVTGHEGCDGKGTLQRAPTAYPKGVARISREELPGDDESQGRGHRLKPVPPAGGRPGGSPLHRGTAAEGKSGRPQVAPTKGNDGKANGEKGARTRVSAPLESQPAPVEPDPRVVLGEDGRVAGAPWPKGEITFARGWRWRRGRGG